MKDKKLLQVVNLAPSESWIEKLTEVHPMKQITYASIIQVCVFGFYATIFLGYKFSCMKRFIYRKYGYPLTRQGNIINILI